MALRLDRASQWIDNVRRVPSPNHDERPAQCDIELLVVHGISLPPGEFGTDHVEALFTNTLRVDEHPFFAEIAALRVSAHVLVKRTGEVTQFVPFTSRAWHAGASAHLGRTQCNDFSIGVELEGTDDAPYRCEQYERLVQIAHMLRARWPKITRANIVGHCDIAPDRKTDPGPAFDWRRFWRMLAS